MAPDFGSKIAAGGAPASGGSKYPSFEARLADADDVLFERLCDPPESMARERWRA